MPEGMKRIGYDADGGRYYFQDSDGSFWRGSEGSEFGELTRGACPRLSHVYCMLLRFKQLLSFPRTSLAAGLSSTMILKLHPPTPMGINYLAPTQTYVDRRPSFHFNPNSISSLLWRTNLASTSMPAHTEPSFLFSLSLQ